MVGFVLFRLGKSAGLLCKRQWTFLFHICWLAVELLASPEALCCMQFACLLYDLVRRMAYSFCVVCCTGLCSHSAALQHLQDLQSAKQPTSRWYRYKLCVISLYNRNLDHHIIKSLEFSVKWNIHMHRQMMRHASSTVALPTRGCWNEDRYFESVPGKVENNTEGILKSYWLFFFCGDMQFIYN